MILGLGRSPGEGKGYPLQYSSLENSVACIVHGVTESDTTERPSLHFTRAHTCRPCMCVFHLSRKQKAKCEEPRAELTLQVGVCGAGSERAGEAERSGHPASAEHLCTASYSLREQSAEFLLSALPFLPLPYLCQVRSLSTLLRPHHSAPCCSVSKLCPVLYDSVDCSTPGFPVLHQLPESAQTHVHSISDAIQPAHPLPPCLHLPSIFS